MCLSKITPILTYLVVYIQPPGVSGHPSYSTILEPNPEIIQVMNAFERQHDKTNKMTCAASEDSDQAGHPPSLISLSYALNG